MDLSNNLNFQQLSAIIFFSICVGSKMLPNRPVLRTSMVISADIFVALLLHFWRSSGNLMIKYDKNKF